MPATAAACGGTFCDGGNPAMAVEQTGETILFVFDGEYVEAHVQIEYDGGDASQFAWIVPLPQVPEVEVGSWRLIDNALDATVPVHGYSNAFTCDDTSSGGPDPTNGFIQGPDAGAASEDPPPRVVAHDTVGAFEYSVLQGGTAASVNVWLENEGYAPNAAAPEIVEEYLDEGMLFLAFKLRHFAGAEDIHPVVIRYQGNEPCVPLRLTRIAAKADMPIRVLFLGDERALPVSYKHVQLNRTRLDWLALGDNYDELVTRAIDEGGSRAFVTEYAGTSALVSTDDLQTDALDASVFETIAVTEVVDQLVAFDLMTCGRSCSYDHELVSSLLSEFVPAPPGYDPLEFYACLECNAALIDMSAWDGPAFAQAFQERVIDPLDHAREMLATWPYLTRLYTRISPEEMLTDPTFAEVAGLPDVPNRLGAQQQLACCSDVWQLPGGRRIRSNGGVWPSWGDDMPWAERVEQWNPEGPPLVEMNASAVIDGIIAAHNGAFGCVDGETTGSTGDAVDDGAQDGTADGTGVDSGEGTTGGVGSGGGLEDERGCGCRSGGSMGWVGGLLIVMLGWRRRWS